MTSQLDILLTRHLLSTTRYFNAALANDPIASLSLSEPPQLPGYLLSLKFLRSFSQVLTFHVIVNRGEILSDKILCEQHIQYFQLIYQHIYCFQLIYQQHLVLSTYLSTHLALSTYLSTTSSAFNLYINTFSTFIQCFQL